MSSYEEIYFVVGRIPRGRVATYGQIARLVGRPRYARQVGYALAATPEGLEIPWHRVVNADGEVSPRAHQGEDELQRTLLEHEGVVFDGGGRISLALFRWRPQCEDV